MPNKKSKEGIRKTGLTIKRPKRNLRSKSHLTAQVPDEYAFYLNGGGVINNLLELEEALGTMDDNTFSFHSNSKKNDFSSWIRDIFNEPGLSVSIAGKNRFDAKNEISRFLNRGAFKR